MQNRSTMMNVNSLLLEWSFPFEQVEGMMVKKGSSLLVGRCCPVFFIVSWSGGGTTPDRPESVPTEMKAHDHRLSTLIFKAAFLFAYLENKKAIIWWIPFFVSSSINRRFHFRE
jgi:hypothetical protein